jgi:hypothetical protein
MGATGNARNANVAYVPQSSSDSATSSRWEDREVTTGRRVVNERRWVRGRGGITRPWRVTSLAHGRRPVDHPQG